jgi:diguanylate cyclase
VSDNEFSKAVQYGDSAMKLLKKGEIPPYPQFYELLYTYATGVNPSLNARINSLFTQADSQTVDLAERLYSEFLHSNDLEERLSTVSEKISSNIESVHVAIGDAMATASSYSGSLAEATGDLGTEMSKRELQLLTAKLLKETKQMQDFNQKLESSLEASRNDISELQRDLDEVRREAMLDPLTKLYNRKCFDQGIDRAILDSRDNNEPLSLILLDIDHFKKFNDNYGHQTGDQVLRLMAMTLKSNVKGQDMAVRYGGEEFAVILPATDTGGAVMLAETIRKAVQAKELLKRSTNEKLGRITASFGVATLRETDNATSLIERADRCLYAAKAAGRNCTIEHNDPRANDDVQVANSAA